MVDVINENGLQVKSATEILADLEAGMRAIYGQDINLDSNSPDGQLLNIFTQSCVDLRELLVQVNNSFDPDQALGRILDERVVINNIERQGGTYTTINIDVVVDRTVTLQGLDASYSDINGTGYTIQDNTGNSFILADTTTLVAGSHSLTFRAQNIGRVETTINTITTPVTIVLGVVSVNNPSAPVSLGQNEETDAQLRSRRARSVSNGASGYLNGLQGLVLAIEGVTDARLYENYTNSTDVNGIPPHCMWLVVEGGANTDIGNAIYERKSYGCNMKGLSEVNITTPSSLIFTAKFDRPTAYNLAIRFEIKRTNPTFVFDLDFIKQNILDNLSYKIGEAAETSSITAKCVNAIQAQGGGGVPINVEISSDSVTWLDYMPILTLDGKWAPSASFIYITVV